jgi:DNA primase
VDQLEEIKSKVDIVELISQYLTLKKAGRNFKTPCPFHNEKTPSFIVSPERQIFKCFGCGEGGDIFGFMMKYENMEFGEALRFLAKKAGVKLKAEYQKQTRSDKESLYSANFLSSEFYHHILLKERAGAKAREYLKKRNITMDSVKKFKLGYAPDSWDITTSFLQKKGHDISNIIKAGLAVTKSGGRGYYDRFRARLMFPIFDLQGNVVGFSGRLLGKKTDKAPKYLNTSDTPVYNKSRLLYGLYQAKDAGEYCSSTRNRSYLRTGAIVKAICRASLPVF